MVAFCAPGLSFQQRELDHPVRQSMGIGQIELPGEVRHDRLRIAEGNLGMGPGETGEIEGVGSPKRTHSRRGRRFA